MAQRVEHPASPEKGAVQKGTAAPPGRRPSRRHEDKVWWLLVPGLMISVLGLVVPIAQIVRVSFRRTEGFVLQEGFSADQYSRMLADTAFWNTTGNTVQITVIVMVGAILIAFPVAYFITYYVPKRWQVPLFILAVIPFWTSYLIRMVAHIPILGRGGVLATIWSGLGLPGNTDILLFTPVAQVLVMIILYTLFAVGPIVFSLSRISPNVLEASRVLGATPFRTFRGVTLPLAWPGIAIGAMFVGIMAIQDAATPLIIGGATSPLLGNVVLIHANSLQWPFAAAHAVVLVVMALLMVSILMRLSGIRRDVVS